MDKQPRNPALKPLKEPLHSVSNSDKTEPVAQESKIVTWLKSPWAKSVALHAAILISLLVSFNFSAKPLMFVSPEMSAQQEPVEIVQATFIDSNVIEQKKREKAQSEAAANKRKADQQRKEKEAKERLRKKRVEEERKKRETEKKEKDRVDKLQEEQLKEKAIAQKREEDARKKVEQDKRQRELEKEMADQLEKEQQTMSQANQRRIMSEVDKYRSLVYSKVQQNLDTDGGFIGLSCTINVRLAPDGLVLQVKAVTGNNALCRIAEAAVLKAGTLPVSKDPEVLKQFRNFDIEVRPEK